MSDVLIKLKRELARGLSNIGLQTIKTDYRGLDLVVPMFRGVGRKLVVPADPWMSRCLKRQLQFKAGAIIDIGANAGIYLVKLRVLDKDRRYIGFEPSSACKFFISEVIRLNGFHNANCYPFALSDKNEVRTLHANSMDDAGASLIQEYRQGESLGHSSEIVTFVGDEFVKMLDLQEGVAAIKIDVEGAELEVLSGLRETISRYKPTFYCEIWAPPEDDARVSQQKRSRIDALLKLLDEYGYCVYGALPDGDLMQINDISGLSKTCRPEYLLVHCDDASAFLDLFGAEKGVSVDAWQ